MGLVFLGRIPQARVVDDMRGTRNVQSDTRSFRRQDHDVESWPTVERFHDAVAIGTSDFSIKDTGVESEAAPDYALEDPLHDLEAGVDDGLLLESAYLIEDLRGWLSLRLTSLRIRA